MSDRRASENIVIQSPMSFSGSARRMWRWTHSAKWATIPLAILCITLAWALVAAWYVVFGLLVVPWRLIRRGGRKRKLADARHRETLNAIRGN